MDPRYQHPQVTALWGLPWTYDAWWRIEQAVIRAQVSMSRTDEQEFNAAEAIVMLTNSIQPQFSPDGTWGNQLDRIIAWEEITKHDVAAFLNTMREFWGEPHARWIHYGLTSSDIVDTAQGMRFKAMMPTLVPTCNELSAAVGGWLKADMMVLGRTHGQPAEPTAMKVRAAHWFALIEPAIQRLNEDAAAMRQAKISGPVGTYAHTPGFIEQEVAVELGLLPVVFGGSQIAPRGHLGRWANSAAELVQACAKVAMDVRLMTTHGEIQSFQSAGQIGSSSMAHKNNPIRAEQITGLARLAAGYASMLQPLDLWLERDISHSCVERVAVPDLWHVVLRAIEQTTQLLNEMKLNPARIEYNLEDNANAAWVHHTTLAGISDGMPYEEAREFGKDVQVESYAISQDAEREFMANYQKW